MKPWRLTVDDQSVAFVLACKASERRELLRLFDSLKADPFQTGDYHEFDDTDRRIEVTESRRFLVNWWADHAVKEIRIVLIDRHSNNT